MDRLVSVAGIKLPAWAVLAALIALIALALGAVLFIPATDEGTRRLGLFLGLLSPVLLSLVVLVRANDAAVRSHAAADSSASSAEHSANASASAERSAVATDKLANGFLDEKIRRAVRDEARAAVHAELEAHDEAVHGIPLGSAHATHPAAKGDG